MFDPYVIPGTDVLKNHLGITDKELLDKAEADITYLKLLDINAWFENRPLNYETLLAIHGYIFGDLYPWAGQLRTIDIFKEEEVLGGVYLRYGDTSSLTDQIVAVLDKLNQVSWSEISLEETIPLFSDLIAKLWLIHPFREGNTRTIIRFAGLFANAKGFPLNSKFLRDHANYVRKSLVLYCVEEAPEKVIS